MANLYVDLSLTTGLNDGTSWVDAYQGVAGFATASGSVNPGDDVWVKGNSTSHSTTRNLDFSITDVTNPVRVWGCKAATATEPPVQGDLVSGLRTGGGTRAYANSPPSVNYASGNTVFSIRGVAYIYGIHFEAGRNVDVNAVGNTKCYITFDECEFEWNQNSSGSRYFECGDESDASDNAYIRLRRCNFLWRHDTASIRLHQKGRVEMYACQFGKASGYSGTPTSLFRTFDKSSIFADVCANDFSSIAPTNIIDISELGPSEIVFSQNKLASNQTLTTGSNSESEGCITFIHNSSITGKTSGSVQDYTRVYHNGTVSTETTAVRIGGADDGAGGGWSWAVDPNAGETQELYHAITSPWSKIWVVGDGTNRTLTIYIANSGSSNYQDDEVYPEVLYVSETGDAQAGYFLGATDVLGSPTNIAVDTGSTWGSGASNHQKFEITIAPDYEGLLRWRVHFAKHFTSSPETLYLCPKGEVA